jgi:hypothetical protein
MATLLTEDLALGARIEPDVLTAATHESAWVSMAKFHKAAALISVGTLGSSATVDAKLEQATDSSGTGAKDITGKAITQLTDAGTDSDKEAWINLNAAELDLANDFDHVRISVTVGTASSDGAAYLFLAQPRFAPASDNDASTVDEIVS